MKKTKVISVSIHKGGSGKSSIASNLGYSLSKLGNKVLLIDTDSQMNLTHSYGLRSNKEKNFYNAFMERESIKKHIIPTNYKNIDFVVSSVRLAGIESEMGAIQLREFVVREILSEIKEQNIYDFIIIDTNPSLGMLNTSVLYGSDYILIPIEPTPFGVEGLDVFIKHYDQVKHHHKELEIAGIVLNKMDARRSKRQEIIQVIEGVFGKYILDSEIKVDSNIENAQWENMPLEIYLKENKKYSDTTKMFDDLAKEVTEIVK